MTNSTTERLALHGGAKTILAPFERYNSIGAEEVAAAKEVIESGVRPNFWVVGSLTFMAGPKYKNSSVPAKPILG
jgi:hypothetical protein